MTAKGRGGDKSRPPRTSHLNKDDADLWSYTARSLEPLRRAKDRVTAAVPEDFATRPGPQRRPATVKSAEAPSRTPRETSAPPLSRSAKPPPLADPDRRRVRKIATGQHEIDARLDLHALRQSEAHRRLSRFLHDAQSAGFGMVLVITGKGSVRKSAGDASDPYPREEPGVIRRAVPLWLAEPGLRALVVSFTSAGPRHGGSGAFYIHIRKRHRR
jgi:DNA-nicking Smr family endonuclease